jgi:hypothetical protein
MYTANNTKEITNMMRFGIILPGYCAIEAVWPEVDWDIEIYVEPDDPGECMVDAT